MTERLYRCVECLRACDEDEYLEAGGHMVCIEAADDAYFDKRDPSIRDERRTGSSWLPVSPPRSSRFPAPEARP
jgi:hypothetical protein